MVTNVGTTTLGFSQDYGQGDPMPSLQPARFLGSGIRIIRMTATKKNKNDSAKKILMSMFMFIENYSNSRKIVTIEVNID